MKNPRLNVLESLIHRIKFSIIRRKYLELSFLQNLKMTLRPPLRIICFYPRPPVPSAVITKLCAVSGFAITRKPPKHPHVAFKYLDDTYPYLKRPDEPGMINGRCRDISKKFVDQVLMETFGYSIAVDPLTFTGKAVEKSDRNARHDGRVIQCPISPDQVHADCVYQRVIDNTVDGNLVMDYRVPVHGGRIPLIYLKYRPVETRFSNTNHSVALAEPADIFTEEELEGLRRFAGRIGIDYGEFDVLRDKMDGRIYVVDANLTPWGPPNGLSLDDQKMAVGKLSQTFEALIKNS